MSTEASDKNPINDFSAGFTPRPETEDDKFNMRVAKYAFATVVIICILFFAAGLAVGMLLP